MFRILEVPMVRYVPSFPIEGVIWNVPNGRALRDAVHMLCILRLLPLQGGVWKGSVYSELVERRGALLEIWNLYIEKGGAIKKFCIAWVRPGASTPLYIWNSPTVTALSGGPLLARTTL